jgi:hypothetical protein
VSDEPFHIATDEEISRLRMNEDYSTLVGPDGWWTFLGEPEDCTWSRDGRDVVDMLNKQAAEIARLTAERDASIAHRSATNEEIKKLHAVIKSKGFSVEDSVALHETRSEAARLTAELHRLAHGADIEGDGMCPHALEAANLRAELAAARAVPADVEALIKEVTDGALEAGSCSALGHTYSLTKDPTWPPSPAPSARPGPPRRCRRAGERCASTPPASMVTGRAARATSARGGCAAPPPPTGSPAACAPWPGSSRCTPRGEIDDDDRPMPDV